MIPFIDYPFKILANAIGASKDELKLVFCILIAYPLSGILKRLPDNEPYKKDLFLIGVSLFYLLGVFNLWDGVRTLFISAAGAYGIATFVQGPYMPWLAFVFIMGHMLVSHIYRELYPIPGIVDVTGAQMVLVMKLTAFCWSVHDGQLPEEDLSDFQKDRQITQMPRLLDYAAYVLFFPSLFAGPAFDYREYQRWIDCSMFDVVVPDAKRGGTKRKRKIPKSHIPATKKAVVGLIWIVSFLKLSGIFSTTFALSDGFLDYSFIGRVLYTYALGFTARCKYYGIWSLTEGACILAGLGYNGVDEQTKQLKWDRITNVDAWRLETAQNTRGYLDAWNMNTNKWLKNYVYLRVTPKGKKPGFRSSLATFGVSALWHGISPGYYATFITASFAQTVAKYFRRHVRPFFLNVDQKSPGPYKRSYDIFGIVVTQLTFGYIVAPFLILTLSGTMKLWSRLYFFVHIGVAICILFFNSPGKAWLQQQLHRKGDRAQLARYVSSDSLHREPGPLGVPEDAVRDLDEIQLELKQRKTLQQEKSKRR